jgi:DNA-binding response OmpR family regulator
MKALIVDDDLDLADVVSFTMRRAGFETIIAHDGPLALERWQNDAPDIIILDLNLPRIDGLAVCQQIRAEDSTPIIILSVRGDEDDVVRGLELGADDYIVKPFSPRQLVARVEAVLRRAGTEVLTPALLKAGPITLDPARREVTCGGGEPVRLSHLECRLLTMLMENAGQVVPADMLIDRVWGPVGGNRDMLKQLVSRLRHKVEPDPSNPVYLETVIGVGYEVVASG